MSFFYCISKVKAKIKYLTVQNLIDFASLVLEVGVNIGWVEHELFPTVLPTTEKEHTGFVSN